MRINGASIGNAFECHVRRERNYNIGPRENAPSQKKLILGIINKLRVIKCSYLENDTSVPEIGS
jgi:hypothetical protein